MVKLLDRIYSLFDEICDKHDVQKMETVGKTYMACAGLQGASKNHALACVQMGIDMLDMISRIRLRDGKEIHIRIGIHTGGVISGFYYYYLMYILVKML